MPNLETTFNNWEAFIDHRPDFLIEDLEIFSDYYVIAERNMGLLKLNVNSWKIMKVTLFHLIMKLILLIWASI